MCAAGLYLQSLVNTAGVGINHGNVDLRYHDLEAIITSSKPLAMIGRRCAPYLSSGWDGRRRLSELRGARGGGGPSTGPSTRLPPARRLVGGFVRIVVMTHTDGA